MADGTVVNIDASTPKISNSDFLAEVFPGCDRHVHVCGFREDPTSLDGLGLRGLWAGGEAQYELPFHPDANTFFTISTFHPDPVTGRSRRRKVQFDRTWVIVLDDVGLRGLTGTSAKVPADKIKLKPSYAIETSPGNWQLGYILDGGDTRGGKVNALLDALVANGLVSDGSDPGMKGVTRYVRLPVGKNTKAKYGSQGHTHVLGSWRPERKYTLEEIADAYGVRAQLDAAPDELNAPVAGNFDPDNDWLAEVLIDAGVVQGFDDQKKLWHVTCPFIEEHSNREDTGTAYLGEGRWTCHHGHCLERDHNEFTDKVRDLFPDQWKKVTRRGMEILGDQAVAPSTKRQEMVDIFGEAVVERAEEQKALGPFQKKMAGGWVDTGKLGSWDPLTQVPAVLKGLVPKMGLGVVYGASGIGKSFVMLDWMLKVASGQDWHGHRNKAEKGDWIYISSEGGPDELRRRLKGWADANTGGVVPANVGFYAVSLGWGKEGVEDAKKFIRWCRMRGSPVRGVIIDTLNRNMGGGDENDTASMTAFVDCCEMVWRGLGCVVPVVHHEGKDAEKGARGSSVLKGAAEFEWRVFRDRGSMVGGISIEKNRHGPDGMVYGFGLDVWSFGVDADGDEVTTLVVRGARAPIGGGMVTRKYSMSVVQAYEVLVSGSNNGWVNLDQLCADAADLYQDEHGGARVRPGEFRREISKHLVPKQGWEVLGDAVRAPDGNQDVTE